METSNGHGCRAGERLRAKIIARRQAKGWSQCDLAEMVRATNAGIYALESGHYVRASLLDEVLKVLGIGPEDFTDA